MIRDVLPDVTAHSILRQWFVQIGGLWNSCEVGLIGYKDGRPDFITMEPEDEDEEDDEE